MCIAIAKCWHCKTGNYKTEQFFLYKQEYNKCYINRGVGRGFPRGSGNPLNFWTHLSIKGRNLFRYSNA